MRLPLSLVEIAESVCRERNAKFEALVAESISSFLSTPSWLEIYWPTMKYFAGTKTVLRRPVIQVELWGRLHGLTIQTVISRDFAVTLALIGQIDRLRPRPAGVPEEGWATIQP